MGLGLGCTGGDIYRERGERDEEAGKEEKGSKERKKKTGTEAKRGNANGEEWRWKKGISKRLEW